ncbi:MAG: hypothetical protein KF812_02320 [Fimbriimonadaceae bacterium]|nr:hypothetical protein [Fimbriimonadaceae bacterium]
MKRGSSLLILLALASTGMAQIRLPGGGNPLDIGRVAGLLRKEPVLNVRFETAEKGLDFLDSWTPSGFQDFPAAQTDGSLRLMPGRYRGEFQSFCLRGYSHGPSRGMGYLSAPFAGLRADLIQNIIRRFSTSNVEQQDCQQLLWSILARTKPRDLQGGAQRAAAALLKPEEIVMLQADSLDVIENRLLGNVLGQFDRALRPLYEAENKMRGMFTRAGTSFEEIERLAVTTGPEDAVSEIPRGRWLWNPGKFFYRVIPTHYSRTTIEVIVPFEPVIRTDELGRIVRMEHRLGEFTEVVYADEFRPKPIPGHDGFLAYPIKSLRVVAEGHDETFAVRNFIICRAPAPSKLLGHFLRAKAVQDDWWSAAQEWGAGQLGDRFGGSAYEAYDSASGAYDAAEQAGDIASGNSGTDRLLDRGHYIDGVEAATTGSTADRVEWIGQTHANAMEALLHAINVLDTLPTTSTTGDGTSFDPGERAYSPANRGFQTLGSSSRGF